jgi:hypothetical protein
MRQQPVKQHYLALVLMVSLLLAACGGDDSQPGAAVTLHSVTARDLQIVTGQIIYVPAYSEIFYNDANRTIRLAVTLAIHNTDLENPIIIQSVRYYNTDGELIREYVDDPIEVPPLATTGFVVEGQDTTGGWGANFIVEWGAETPVYEPVIEAVMISSGSTQGFSITSIGRVLSQTFPEDGEEGN